MELRQLGQSQVKATAIAFGAWAIGGFMWAGSDDEAARAAIRRGLDLRLTSIDTAAVYGFGHSERLVGKTIAVRQDEVQLLVKFGMQSNRRIDKALAGFGLVL